MTQTYWETGWASPVGGFYARGVWRIQRLTTGWHWRCVLDSGVPHPHAGKQGKAHTLKATKSAVDREEGGLPQ